MLSKVWVISACLNEQDSVSSHISYLNQINKIYSIKYVICDGGSTDDTPQLVRACIANGCLFFENTGTIYQSWNYALNSILNKSTHVIFLGVGDLLTSQFIELICNERSLNDIDIYVSSIKINERVHSVVRRRRFNCLSFKFFTCMPFPHCGTVFNIGLFHRVGLFNTMFLIVSDLDWIMRLKNFRDLRIVRADIVGVWMRGGGLSAGGVNLRACVSEELKVARLHRLLPCPMRMIYFIFCMLKRLQRNA
jgi:glycosyltransferase involved in cell wall biosynthesis